MAREMVSEGAAETGTLFREQRTPPQPPSAHSTWPHPTRSLCTLLPSAMAFRGPLPHRTPMEASVEKEPTLPPLL